METLFDKPPERTSPTSGKAPRKYQLEAIQKTIDCLEKGENPLLIMATGTGKTFTGSQIINRRLEKGRVLWLAHREELIDQAKEAIESVTGVRCGVEMGNFHSLGTEEIVVASIQSLHPKRLQSKFQPNHFSDIWVDEAHHVVSKSYLDLLEYFPEARKLGLTATPDRGDKKGIGKVYSTIAYNYSLLDAIKEKNLSPIRGVRIDIDIDLSQVGTVAGDFNQGELDDVMSKELVSMAEGIHRETRDNRTIVFTVSVQSAHHLAELLRDRGLKAEALDGTASKEERKLVISRFRRGETTHLINCALFTEGFDAPETDAVVIGRPTKSRSLYSQMVGRGTRLFPGKEYMKLVEFTYSAVNHQLVKPYELFISERYDEEVRKKAEELAEEQSLFDILDTLEVAKEELHKEALNKAKITSYGKVEYDPLALLNIAGVSVDQELTIEWEGRTLKTEPGTISRKQADVLRRFNIVGIERLSTAHASKLISTIAENKWKVENILARAV